MATTEMLVDEIADDMGLDAIDLRRRNVIHTGWKNTQGAIPGGALRADELLALAAQDPLWTGRADRKAIWEAANPGLRYGVGFACVHKDYGTGAEAAMVQIEISPQGKPHMRHVTSEIGCGSTTAQLLIPAEHLGRPADTVDFAAVEWPSLPLTSTDEPYTMSQEEQDRQAQNPRWVPRLTSPRSASNSAYYMGHTTREAARLLFELGLWNAALSIWTATMALSISAMMWRRSGVEVRRQRRSRSSTTRTSPLRRKSRQPASPGLSALAPEAL